MYVTEMESRFVVAGWGWAAAGATACGYGIPVGADEDVLELGGDDGCPACECPQDTGLYFLKG